MRFKSLHILLIILLTLTTVTLSVSAQDVSRAETAIFDVDGGIVDNPDNWNPFVPGRRKDHGYHQAILEPLFILNYETGNIDPWLAVSGESNDTQDVWTITLREGIKWSDGEDFNADDIVFTVNMLKDNPSLVDASQIAQWVDSVEKVDDLTIQFNLTAPNPRFILDNWSVRIWGGPVIVPEHIWADEDPFTFDFNPPIGTGPYTLTNATQTEIIYDRNDDWWGVAAGFQDLPAPSRLIWRVFENEQVRSLEAAAGNVDSVMDITLGAWEAITAQNPNFIAWFDEAPFAWPDPCPRQLSFNNLVPPWDNPEMREAVNLAIDRGEVIEFAYEGTTTASETFFVNYTGMRPFIDPIVEAGLAMPVSADPDAAKALIEANGWVLADDGFYEKDGEKLTLEIQANQAFIEKIRIAQVVVEQLRRIGIDAISRTILNSTWDTNKAVGNYEAVLDWDACNSVNEPWATMDRFHIDNFAPIGEEVENRADNHVRWQNQEYSDIVDQLGVLPLGDPQIPELVLQAFSIWREEIPFVPITQAKKLIPFNTEYWVGWPSAENNFNHPATWWQSTHQIIHNLEPAGG